MIGKKISEVNELIKGKRNITVQWDILLSILFHDPEQKWIKLQVDYDYQTTKASMALKIQELFSHQKKTKEHEVFEDF
jgi:plasmid maintenance system antidote protein VapI